MNRPRIVLPSLLLAALVGTGCFLVSGQFLVSINLDSPLRVTHTGSNFAGLEVDLRTNSTYNDHKDKIKDIADFALLGEVHNQLPVEARLDVYLFDGPQVPRTLGQITAGTKLWGTLVIPPNGDVHITWDQSAALFGAGKAALLNEIRNGDGLFTLYAVSSTATFDFEFLNGVFVVVLAAGTG